MPWTKVEVDARRFMAPKVENGRVLSYQDALREAHVQALETDPRVFVMGEGVDDCAGSFGTTTGLKERFGAHRVFDVPLAENACMGVAVGAAIAGMRPIYVHLRVDFNLLAMDQIVNHAAKWCYMFSGRQKVPLVVRSVIGRGWGSAAQHSQSLQGMLQSVPGLKLVMPASAYDAKGLLLASIADDSPVMLFEHRWLYGQEDHVPESIYTIRLGRAVERRKGSDVTVAALSLMVHEALAAAEELSAEGVDVEVLDMRCVKPLDREALAESVLRTGRLVAADTGNIMGGWTAEVAAFASEELFESLRAPVVRVGLPDVPTPASPVLEKAFYPGKEAIVAAVRRVLGESAKTKAV